MSSSVIAIVDDEPDVVASLERLFRVVTSHRIVPFTSGAEFLRWIDGERPDGVILDLAMPSPNGPEILRHLRPGAFGRTPVIVITGSGQDLVDEAIAAGATAVLKKPFDFGELLARLEGALAAS